METVRAWLISTVCAIMALLVLFTITPRLLDYWDKARAQTRIEVKNMEATADFLRERQWIRPIEERSATRGTYTFKEAH